MISLGPSILKLKKKISNTKLKNKELYKAEKENPPQQTEKQRTLST